MRHRLAMLVLISGLAGSMPATAHLETELYIPIGESPGISNVKTQIGRIEAQVAKQNGLTLLVGNSTKYVTFSKTTKIYLQYATPGQRNRVGSYSDCQVDRTAEVYLGDDGSVRWIKVQMP